MGIWNWKYTASDLADWFDAEDEKYWAQHDEWLIDTQLRGETRPVFVFASWFNDRLNTLPQRVNHAVAGSVVDVLRLGSDLDFSSGWGATKGVLLNLSRVAMLIGPISSAVSAGSRYAGLLATSRLSRIAGAKGPCSFVSINNVLSFLKGQSVQIFATVDDIVAVANANRGIAREALLASEPVREALLQYGVKWERVVGLRTVDDVLRLASTTDRPIVFSIQWLKANNEVARHALTAVRDASGAVRILDYVAPGVEGFRGFGSLAEMAAARPQWGSGFLQAVLRADQPVVAFETEWLKLLQFADGTYQWGLPVSMGMQWLRGRSAEERLASMSHSAWRFLKAKLGDEVPTPPSPTQGASPPPDAKPPASAAPATQGLGVTPVAAQAAGAPRIDWLTGVQYRLKYLGYYRGAVTGTNDDATKTAVRAFQEDWFSDPSQWDAIPGPVTQGMLHAVVGW